MCLHDSHGFIGGLSELQQWVSQRYPLVSTIEGQPVDGAQLIKQSFIDYVRKSEVSLRPIGIALSPVLLACDGVVSIQNVFVYIKIKLREQPLGMLVFEV